MANARLARARGGSEIFLANVCITQRRSAMTIARHVKHAALALIALSSVGVLQGAYANGTASGTTISNQATVDYSVGGVSQAQITSAAASFVVDTKIDFTVNEVSTNATQTHPGQTNVVTTFSVTNTGNSTQGFVLSVANETGTTLFTHDDNLDVTNLRTFVDSNGNGTYDAGTDTAANINSLVTGPAGVSVTVFVLADVPAGAANNTYANVRLTARATPVGSTTPIAQTAGADTAGVDVVWADAGRDNSESAADQYAVSVALTLTKTAALISDPFNGTTSPKAIPGAVMEYTILVTNSSTVQDATGVSVTDNIPANTSFQPGSIQLNGGGLPDSNFIAGPPARVVVSAGTVVKNNGTVDGTATVKFRVTIN
jgi:uncharacterized repeat protein (TIGR01451 family)